MARRGDGGECRGRDQRCHRRHTFATFASTFAFAFRFLVTGA